MTPGEHNEVTPGEDVVVIELDPTRAADVRAPGRRRGEVPRGWWVLLAVAVCGLLAGSASDRSGVRVVARLPVGVGTFVLDGDTVLVLRPTALGAWDARTGRQRWSRDVADHTRWDTATSRGGTELLVSAACAGAGTGETAAIDRTTGRELWRRPGIPLDGAGGIVLSTSSWIDRCDGPHGATPLSADLTWTAVDPATGAVTWRTTVAEGTVVAVDDRAGAWAALVDSDGGLSTVDLTTGVRSAVVSHAVTGPVQLIAHGDTLVVARLTFRGPIIDATTGSRLGSGENGSVPSVIDLDRLDRHTLARQWHTSVVADPSGFSPQFCGENLCVNTDRTVALDPATGAVRWSVPLRGFAARGGVLLAGPRFDGYFVGADPGIAIADPHTGRTVAALPAWHVLGLDPSSGRLVVGEVRPTRTLLAVLDGTRPVPFAAIPAQVLFCQANASTLVCLAADHAWVMSRP